MGIVILTSIVLGVVLVVVLVIGVYLGQEEIKMMQTCDHESVPRARGAEPATNREARGDLPTS